MNAQSDFLQGRKQAQAMPVKRTLSFGVKNPNLEINTDLVHPTQKLSGIVQVPKTPILDTMGQTNLSRLRDKQAKTTKNKSVVANHR